jgi:hypothetical protein
MDRIAYLLKRRQEPEMRREEIIRVMGGRSNIRLPKISLVIGARYPQKPLFNMDDLLERLQRIQKNVPYELQHYLRELRRIQSGFVTRRLTGHDAIGHHLEVNLQGILLYEEPLHGEEVRSQGDERIISCLYLVEIVLTIARLVRIGGMVFNLIPTNLLVRVTLDSISDLSILIGGRHRAAFYWYEGHKAIESSAQCEVNVLSENLDAQFPLLVQELVRDLMYAFDWAGDNVVSSIRDILQANNLLKGESTT